MGLELSSDLAGVLEDIEASLPLGSLPARIFGDRELYEIELERVFARAWVFMAHESEIPAVGDYVVRRIGEDPFIVVRDDDGHVRVFFDACRHRGVPVCRADNGNTSHFRCPYHGWTYNTKGALVGAPLWQAAFGGMSKEDKGLACAPAVESFHGFVFATLDPAAPSLREYLGGIAWYLDLLFGLNENGVEVVGPPQRFVIDANWKSPAENFAGDDYHLGTLHRSVWEIGAFPVPFKDNMMGYHIQASPGHSLSFSMAPHENDPGPKFFGFPDDLAATFSTNQISQEQLDVARRSRVLVTTVFPNFSLLALPMTEDPNYPPTGVMTIRLWAPRGPGSVEVWNWFLVWKHASPEQKDRAYKAGLGTFSMGGSFEMDDTEPWIGVARTGRSTFARMSNFQLNYQMGLPGVGSAKRVDDWPGPGICFWPRYDEGVQRNFYKLYVDFLKGGAAYPKTSFDDEDA